LAREALLKDEAKRKAKAERSTKPAASVIIATALFGVFAFLPDGEPTWLQIYNTLLIFGAAAMAVACYRSLT
jgi:protein-S-isoprenylcysteine O-methyltransferase Ste14